MLIEAHGPLWSKNKWRKALSLLTSRTKLLLFSTSSFAAEVQEIHFQLWQGRCTHSCWGLQLVKNLRCERQAQCRHKRGWLMAQLLFTFISITRAECSVLQDGKNLYQCRSLSIIPIKTILFPTPEGLCLIKGSADPAIKQRIWETRIAKPALSHGRIDK